jgi:soluble lytic murein transglycosylase-like protein
MKMKHATQRMLLIVLGLWCIPGRAQIRQSANEHGNLVYVNDLASSPTRANLISAATSVPKSTSNANSARATTPEELDHIVETTAQKHRVDPRLVRAVIKTESNWNTAAVSSKGAQGLMQLHPFTAQQLGVVNAFDPALNVDGGVRYLGMMLDRYNGDLPRALAAYNAGPGAVDRSGGVPRFAETRNYVQKVTSAYFGGTEGTGVKSAAVAKTVPIYRAVEADGRVIFRNE